MFVFLPVSMFEPVIGQNRISSIDHPCLMILKRAFRTCISTIYRPDMLKLYRNTQTGGKSDKF
jgi:hypothetical protein